MSEEHDIQSAIIATLLAMGHWCKRHNAGSRGRIRMGLGEGTPDLHVIVKPSGRAVWLEVKAKKGVVSEGQVSWMRQAREHGAFVAVVRSVGEAIEAVRRAERGEAA